MAVSQLISLMTLSLSDSLYTSFLCIFLLWHSYLLFNWFHSNPLHFAFEYAMLSDKAINVSFIVCRTFQHWKKEAIASGHSVLHQQQSGCYHCCCYLCYCYRCSCCCFCFHYCFYLFSFVQGVGGDFARCSLGSLLNRRGWHLNLEPWQGGTWSGSAAHQVSWLKKVGEPD